MRRTTVKESGKQKQDDTSETLLPTSGVMTRSQRKRQSLLLNKPTYVSIGTQTPPVEFLESKIAAETRKRVQNPNDKSPKKSTVTPKSTPAKNLIITSPNRSNVSQNVRKDLIEQFNVQDELESLNEENKNISSSDSEANSYINSNDFASSDVSNGSSHKILNKCGMLSLDVVEEESKESGSLTVAMNNLLNKSSSANRKEEINSLKDNFNVDEKSELSDESENKFVHLKSVRKVNKDLSQANMLVRESPELHGMFTVNSDSNTSASTEEKKPSELNSDEEDINNEHSSGMEGTAMCSEKQNNSEHNSKLEKLVGLNSDEDINNEHTSSMEGTATCSKKQKNSEHDSKLEKLNNSAVHQKRKSIKNEQFIFAGNERDSSGSMLQHLSVNKSNTLGFSPVSKNEVSKYMKSDSSDSDSDAESRKAIMESAQKRIIQNISTSESESRKFMRPLTKTLKSNESSDSDSAPDNISFTTGRQMAMKSLKNAVESIQKEKQRRKEKRKQMLEKYKQQKEEKLIRLKEKRASQEDASCSSSEESGYEEQDKAQNFGVISNKKHGLKQEKENLDDVPQPKVRRLHNSDDDSQLKERKERKRTHERSDSPSKFGELKKLPKDVLENLRDQIPTKLQKMDNETASKEKKKNENKHSKHEGVRERKPDFRTPTDVDYIPLNACGATEFGIMPLDKMMKAPKSMAEQAADFRQKMLYGSHIKRGPANMHQVYHQKLKMSGKDRFVR